MRRGQFIATIKPSRFILHSSLFTGMLKFTSLKKCGREYQLFSKTRRKTSILKTNILITSHEAEAGRKKVLVVGG